MSERLAHPPTAAERAATHRALSAMHPSNRFRLMFGLPLLPEKTPPMKSTKLYFPQSADAEIEITIARREFNGISSDPKVITSEPKLADLVWTLKQATDRNYKFETTLDYPEQS